jgi:plasmid stabilization system protein ParE
VPKDLQPDGFGGRASRSLKLPDTHEFIERQFAESRRLRFIETEADVALELAQMLRQIRFHSGYPDGRGRTTYGSGNVDPETHRMASQFVIADPRLAAGRSASSPKGAGMPRANRGGYRQTRRRADQGMPLPGSCHANARR